MVKWRMKKTAAAGGGESTEALIEKKEDKGPVKGGSDAPEEEVVVNVPLHCVGCARKVRRCLQRLEGVDDVIVDFSTNTVVVKGRKALENPMMVVEVAERRTGKKALLLSPSPAKLPPPWVKSEETKRDATEDMKNDIAEMDMEMVVVLRIGMHCDACSEEMKTRILKIEGVEEAVPHLKSSQVIVKGMIEPATLVGFIHRCTGRKAAIIRAEPLHPPAPATIETPLMEAQTPADAEANQQDPSDNLKEKKEGVEEGKKQEEKRGGEEDKMDAKLKMEKRNEGDGAEEGETEVEKPSDAGNGVIGENHTKDHLSKLPVPPAVVAVAPESEKMAVNSLYQYYYHPAYAYAYPHYAYQEYQYPQLHPYASNPAVYGSCPQYPPQSFSDDQNPDACTIM